MSASVLATVGLAGIGRSLRESFYMFWETFWPLVLGFSLSGAVQAFVSKQRMQRALGDHRPAAVLRASGYGMVSSSCSYAASAMAKSLFQRGADFVSATVFMVASTNLVVELGIVLLVLLGWRFAAAEFVGGPIMIVLLVALGGLALRGSSVARARRRLEERASATTTTPASRRRSRRTSTSSLRRRSSARPVPGPTRRATPSPTSPCCGASSSSATSSPGSSRCSCPSSGGPTCSSGVAASGRASRTRSSGR